MLGLTQFNIHPGSSCGKISQQESIQNIAKGINQVKKILIAPIHVFYPGSHHFLIPDPDPNIFSSRIPDPTLKVECNLPFFASFAFRSKVLVLVFVIVKKFRDPKKIHP
jgi:hypothetical protein